VRKVISATRIAKTSLTSDNIIYIIDCGLSNQITYSPKSGVDSLIVTPITEQVWINRTAPGRSLGCILSGAISIRLKNL
jgi:hypothetical protein